MMSAFSRRRSITAASSRRTSSKVSSRAPSPATHSQGRSGAAARRSRVGASAARSEEHTSELQSPDHLVCRLLLEKKKQPHPERVHGLATLQGDRHVYRVGQRTRQLSDASLRADHLTDSTEPCERHAHACHTPTD